MPIRNTKIVATIGPASSTKETIAQMIRAGMDVARINFSHGTQEDHRQTIQRVRAVSKELNKPIAIIQDLCGPKLRLGQISPEPITLAKGASFILTTKKVIGSSTMASMPAYPALLKETKKNHRILINDGSVQLKVESVTHESIITHVEKEGVISSHKGLNFPDASLHSLPALTAKDKNDLLFGISHGVDYVALSFVRSAYDIRTIKNMIKKSSKNIPVIAKIEKHEACQHLEDIIKEADSIMVARGDLGVETDLETVTLKQKEIIKLCNIHGKPVITATQMLETMIEKPSPTRAEVADITNAIFDGTDALMLSGETAVGKFPVEAVAMMARIALKTEDAIDYEKFISAKPLSSRIADAVAHAACVIAHAIQAQAIITATLSGSTARMISRYRPHPPIITVTPNRAVLQRLNLVWGIYPFLIPHIRTTDVLINEAKKTALSSGMVKKGDTVIICAGNLAAVPGKTDLIKILQL